MEVGSPDATSTKLCPCSVPEGTTTEAPRFLEVNHPVKLEEPEQEKR